MTVRTLDKQLEREIVKIPLHRLEMRRDQSRSETGIIHDRPFSDNHRQLARRVALIFPIP